MNSGYVSVGEYLYNKPRQPSCLQKNVYVPHSDHDGEVNQVKLNKNMVVEEEYKPPQQPIKIVMKTAKVNTYDPKVWGPAFWFSLHTSAAHYPLEASPIVKERMKARILAIPYEIPCRACMTHASAFIEANRDRLDEIVSNRHSLGKFYVDFHNKVNKRYNKPEWTYDQAYKKYSGDAEITFAQYE